MLDWLIVGGGIHGTLLSHFLRRRVGVAEERLRVLDPYDAPLARWEQMTANVGMAYLRSPLVHHLHFDPYSLRTFAQTFRGQAFARFIPTHSRPSLDLFRAHSQWLIEHARLGTLRLNGRAHGLARVAGGWRVESDGGGVEARRVILAFGVTEQPAYPDWARGLPHTRHIFDPDFRRSDLHSWTHAVVVGGGITGAQTALTLAAQQPGQQPGTVTVVMRHPVRQHDFDSDPCWVVPQCLDAFHREPDFDRRRAIISAARHRGSMPPDVADDLRQAARDGRLRVVQAEVTAAQSDEAGVTLALNNSEAPGSGETLRTDCLILATGFAAARPGGAWLDAAVNAHALPTAADGYPIVDETLCWGDGLYVSGALAELMVGPTARNIIGARLAAERIKAAL